MGEHLEELLKKYQSNTASAAEKALLKDWMMFGNFAEQGLSDKLIETSLTRIETRLPLTRAKKIKLWPRIAIAAAVLVIGFGTGLFYFSKYPINGLQQTLASASKLQPGTQAATLILASGKEIHLTDAVNGQLAQEAGVKITKTADGQLVYVISSERSDERTKPQFNTLTTTKGETYAVILPDGSKVWLNAASSLKYPANFAALKERRVELTGEAYFEVAKSPTTYMPFFVKTATQTVEVLGTHFNINTYTDEPAVKTTLLEGSVSVRPTNEPTNQPIILKPGQQAVNQLNESIKIIPVETDDVIAWKNGFFTFDKERMESIMTKISRWYNIQVQYEDPSVKEVVLYGSFSRFENFATVVKILERTGLVTVAVRGNSVKISSKK